MINIFMFLDVVLPRRVGWRLVRADACSFLRIGEASERLHRSGAIFGQSPPRFCPVSNTCTHLRILYH